MELFGLSFTLFALALRLSLPLSALPLTLLVTVLHNLPLSSPVPNQETQALLVSPCAQSPSLPSPTILIDERTGLHLVLPVLGLLCCSELASSEQHNEAITQPRQTSSASSECFCSRSSVDVAIDNEPVVCLDIDILSTSYLLRVLLPLLR